MYVLRVCACVMCVCVYYTYVKLLEVLHFLPSYHAKEGKTERGKEEEKS